jgi:hypothetical protein
MKPERLMTLSFPQPIQWLATSRFASIAERFSSLKIQAKAHTEGYPVKFRVKISSE